MERLTTNKNVADMGMFELAHNCCYIAEDGTGMYRDYERDVDQRELVRELMKQLAQEDMPSNPISFDETMMDYLALNPCQDVSGLIALLYHNMWAMADLRERLKRYEDAEEQGLLLRLPISRDTPVYSIEYCCGMDKNNQIGMCVRGFCKDCDDKAYFIRESTANYCNICEIQKSVFFTREEAEAKLKEMERSHE